MAKGQASKTVKELLSEVQEIDPLGVVIITSAGIAGACGIKGPLTTMVTGIAGMFSGEATGPAGIVALGLTPVAVYEGLDYISKVFSGSPDAVPLNATDEQKKQMVLALGGAAGNMVEAGLMYTLFKNPETLKAIFDMGKETAKAGMGAAKAVGGLL